jgi:hypothetical protein
VTLPLQPVPKTREALAAYEDAGNEVPSGIWYEVAVAEFLSEQFKKGEGARIVLYPWGAYEDTVLGRDALLVMPGATKGIPMDFTTDDRRKKNLVFLLHKRWFVGLGRHARIDTRKPTWVESQKLTVAEAVIAAFRQWFKYAQELPRVDLP